MSMTDPIADMLTRIRNAAHAQHPFGRVQLEVAEAQRRIALRIGRTCSSGSSHAPLSRGRGAD